METYIGPYIALLLLSTDLISIETSINGVRYGRVTTPYVISELRPALNDCFVTAIQEDENDRGHFVITTKTAIYRLSASTSSNNSMTLVAGHDTEYGLELGNGTESRFNGIYGMVQMEGDYLVTDHRNYCLRLAKGKSSEQTITYAGACGTMGDQDGSLDMARFYMLYGIKYNNGSIYITDHRRIRRLIISENLVQTIHVSENHILYSFVIGREQSEFFVTAYHGVMRVLNQKETWLVGSPVRTKSPDTSSDGQFSGVKFTGPKGIEWLNNNTLLVASAYEAVMKIVDIEKWTAHSICAIWGFDTFDGDTSTCQLNYPWSILVTDEYIYIGEKTTTGGVRRISYSLSVPKTEHTATPGPHPYGTDKGTDKPEGRESDEDPVDPDEPEISDKFCDAPPYVKNTDPLISKNATYGVGSLVVYRCRNGYSDTNNSSGSLTCALFNDQVYWVGDEPVCTLSALSTEIVIVAALSGGLLLALILLITFIILNFNIKHKLHNLKGRQSNAHSHTSMPAIPHVSLEDLTGRVAPSHLATDSDYSEIRSVMSGTYMDPDYLQQSDVSSRIQSDYVGPDSMQIN